MKNDRKVDTHGCCCPRYGFMLQFYSIYEAVTEREGSFVRRGICLLCVLIVLFCLCPARAEENRPLAYAFDLGFSMDPTVVPREYARDAEGWSALLEKSRLSGTWIEARDGSDCFDIDLNFSVTDRKTATVPLHMSGNRSYVLFESPLLGDQRMYLYFLYFPYLALMIYDYFGIPLQEATLLFNSANDFPLQKLKAFWMGAFPPTEGESCYTPDQLKEIAARLKGLLAAEDFVTKWISAIGIRSGLDALAMEEVELLEDYVDEAFEKGLMVTRTADGEVWSTGDTVVKESRYTDGNQTYSLHLPPSFGNGVSVDINRRETREKLSLSAKIASVRETYLDLHLEGTVLPETVFFEQPFVLDIRSNGYMTGDVDFRILGETGEGDTRALILYLKDADGNEKEAFRISGTIRAIPEAENPAYDNGMIEGSINLMDLNEYTLANLTNQLAEPFVRGILPVLVEVPPLSCQVILDELTDCGILLLLSSDFELER